MEQNKIRKRQIKLALSRDEEELIRKKMASIGTSNMNAYLRKMAIDGLIVRLDDPEIKELVSLLAGTRDRLDEILGRLKDGGTAGRDDLDGIRADQRRLIELANGILFRLAAIK